MADSTVKVGMEVGGVTSAAQTVATSFGQINGAIENFIVTGAKLNSKGKIDTATLLGFSGTGQQVEQLVKRIPKDQREVGGPAWEILRTNIKAAADEVSEFTKKQKEAAETTKLLAARTIAESALAGAFDPSKIAKAGVGRGSALLGAQDKLVKALAGSEVAEGEVQDIFKKLQAGQRDLEVGARGKVQKALLDIIKAYEGIEKAAESADKKQDALNKKNATAAEKAAKEQEKKNRAALLPQAEIDLREKFKPLTGATDAQTSKYEAAIQRVLKMVADGKITIQQFNDLLAKGVDVKKGIPGLTPDEAKARAALAQVATAFDEVEGAGAKAGKSILISWSGVVRLFETQVIRKVFRSIIDESIAAVSEFAKLTVQIGQIQAITQDAGFTTKQWANELRRLSDNFNVPLVDATSAAYELLLTRVVDAANASSFLSKALQLSQVYGISAKESITLLTNTIQAFKLDAIEVNRVMNVLSKSVEDGNVNLNDFAQGISHIGPTAKALGISFEETAAAVSTLTIQGVRTNDAIHLIEGLMQKLIRPTGEMVQLFKEWGVATGEAAIQTYGLGGVLTKLQDEARKGGISKIGEIEKDFRAIKGALGLSTGAFAEFENQLNKASDSSERFAKSQEIVKNTIGYQFEQSVNKIKNIFTIDIAQSFVTQITALTKPLGGLANIIDNISSLIKYAVEILIAYGAALVAIRIATLAYSATIVIKTAVMTAYNTIIAATTVSTGLLAVASTVATAAISAMSAAFLAFGPQIIIAGVLLAAFWASTDKAAREAAVGVSQLTKAELQLHEDRVKKLQETYDEDVKNFKKSYDEKFSIVTQYIASIRKDLTKQQEDIFKKKDPLTENIFKGFDDVRKHYHKDEVKNPVHEVETIIEKIKVSEKTVRELEQKSEHDKFERSIAGESPLKKHQLIEERVKKLNESAIEAFGKGIKISEKGVKIFDIDNIEKARKGLEEAGKLLHENTNLKEIAASIKQSEAIVQGLHDSREAKRFERSLKDQEIRDTALNPANAQINSTKATFALVEKLKKDALGQYQKGIETFDIQNIENARKTFKDISDILDRLIDRQIAFREKAAKLGVVFTTPLTGKGSELDSKREHYDFLNKNAEKVFQEYQRKRLKDGQGAIDRNADARIYVEKAYQEAYKERAKEILANEQKLLKTQQALLDVERIRTLTAGNREDILKKGTKAGVDIDTDFKEYKKKIKDIEAFGEALQGSGFDRISVIGSDRDKLAKKYNEELAELKKRQHTFESSTDKTPEDYDKLRKQTDITTAALQKLEDAHREVSDGNQSIPNLKGVKGYEQKTPPYEFNGTRLYDLTRDIDALGSKISGNIKQRNQSTEDLEKSDKSTEQIGDVLKSIPERYRQIGEAAKKANEVQQRGAEDYLKTIKEIIEQLQKMDEIINKKIAPQLPPPDEIIDGKKISLLSPDFNSNITNAPTSYASSYNSNSANQNASFGDINITIENQGNDFDEKDARKIAAMIRREVQRGNSLLS